MAPTTRSRRARTAARGPERSGLREDETRTASLAAADQDEPAPVVIAAPRSRVIKAPKRAPESRIYTLVTALRFTVALAIIVVGCVLTTNYIVDAVINRDTNLADAVIDTRLGRLVVECTGSFRQDIEERATRISGHVARATHGATDSFRAAATIVMCYREAREACGKSGAERYIGREAVRRMCAHDIECGDGLYVRLGLFASDTCRAANCTLDEVYGQTGETLLHSAPLLAAHLLDGSVASGTTPLNETVNARHKRGGTPLHALLEDAQEATTAVDFFIALAALRRAGASWERSCEWNDDDDDDDEWSDSDSGCELLQELAAKVGFLKDFKL